MWVRFKGKSDGAKDDEKRRRSDSSTTRRSKGPESVVSTSSSRRPSGRGSRSNAPESVASSYATFATARDDRDEMISNADLYEDPRDDDRSRRRRDEDDVERSVYSRRDRSRSRDRGDGDRKKDRKKRKSRSEAGSSRPAEIVESPRQGARSVPGLTENGSTTRGPEQNGSYMMSGGLPAGALSSHVHDQFPGQNPAHFAPPFVPQGPVHTNSFGEAAEYYGDQGESVQHQPGVRIERPSVIIPVDQAHLMAASAQANPIADTGSGAAAEFYGTANMDTPPSQPPRPSSMPGAFTDDEPSPARPPRPSSKPGKLNSAAALVGAAGLGYTMGHESSSTQHSTSYTNGVPGASASMYYQGENPSAAATNSSYAPTYSEAVADMPPPKPPRPGKPEKQPSGSSHAGLYAAGAAGLAAYGLAHAHRTDSHTHAMPGGFPGDQYNGHGPSPGSYMTSGMIHRHEHQGPVSKFADWWKNLDDVRKMEEYTEYIGVCKGCFDPRSSPMDAPRKHHYNRKRSGELRPSGIKQKQSRYGLNEKASRLSLSGDEKRDKRKSTSTAGWIATGLGSVGLVKAGQALWNNRRDDFDDTYSVRSGRHSRPRQSRSRSRSRDHTRYSSSHVDTRYRSRSRDRMSRTSVGITGDGKDYKFVRRHSVSRSRSRSRSQGRKSGAFGTVLGAGLAATAIGAAREKHRSRSRSRSHSPQRVFVHHRRDSSDHDRRYSKNHRMNHKSSRSSIGSASIVDVSRPHQTQGGFLGGFFAAAPPKEKEKRRKTHSSSKKKKKGFFSFGNGSSSSSDSELAFGPGYVRQKKRASRKSSDEKLNATLVTLGATAAAIAAAKAGRNKGRHRPEVVAVRDTKHSRNSRHRYSGGSRYGYEDADGWEDLPDDDATSLSGASSNSGLAFGDYDWKKGKSQESLVSNGSGTNKWGWRWGSKKKKKPSTETLNNAAGSTALLGSAAAAAAAGTVVGANLHRQDSSASSAPTLQTVHPVPSNDPHLFDARLASSVPPTRPLVASQTVSVNLQQPQPIHQIPDAIFSTQGPPQPGYVTPIGPPVFSQPPYPIQSTEFDSPHHPVPPRRANSSPIQSSWKHDATIAAVGAGIGGAAVAAASGKDRPSSSASNVRFEFTQEQARKERDRRREEERERRREEEREAEQERERRRHEDDERREQERRQNELRRQQEEARKHLEAERLAKIETERREAVRRREQEEKDRQEREERIARKAREKAEELERLEREKLERRLIRELEETQRLRELEAQERRNHELELEEEQMLRERRDSERRAAEQREAERRKAEIQSVERERREREAAEYSQRYESERERRQLEEREHSIVEPNAWQTPAAVATVATVAAAITSATISSKRDDRSVHADPSEPSSVKTVEPTPVKTIAPSEIVQDYADDDIFNPNMFKKPKYVSSISEPGSAKEVLQEWEDRYTSKDEPVSQADFFAPKELLEKTSAPVPKFDPNEGATDLHIYQAHDGFPRNPPYPPPYGFTITKDGRGPPYPVPTLNLIQPTPPGSKANSVRGVSLPPSPAIEPVPEPEQEEPKQEDTTRRGSRVSWGENRFHNYEVPTPDSYREQFISDHDFNDQSKQSQNEIVVEPDSPESDSKTTIYRPYVPSKIPEPEIPASTQYVQDQDNDDWGDTMSRKASKKDRKKAKAAAATAAAAITTVAVLAREDEPDNFSVITDPFSDKHATSSVVSSIPSTSNAYQSTYHESTSDVGMSPGKPVGFVEGEVTEEPEQMHVPGSFDEEPVPDFDKPIDDDLGLATKKGKKKKKSKGNDELFLESPKAIEAEPLPESKPVQDVIFEPAAKLSKKEKKKRKSRSGDVESFAQDFPATVASPPVPEPESEPFIQDSPYEVEKTSEDNWSAAAESSRGGKKNNDFRDAKDKLVLQNTLRITELQTDLGREPESEQPPKDDSTLSSKLSKKERKKKAKAAKKASADGPDDTETSQSSTPIVERDIRDIEPVYEGSSSTTKAAMAGGFAGLIAAAMKQDQERMSSDLEHARKNLELASRYSTDELASGTNGNRTVDEADRRVSIPSTAFHDVDELAEVKTPKKKKRTSGRWSPSIGSPLRSEVQYDDYVGSALERTPSREAPIAEVTTDLGLSDISPEISRNAYDSGYYAPDDQTLTNPADKDSDEFFSAGSDEQRLSKGKSSSSGMYDDRDVRSVISSGNKHDDDLDREERHRRHRHARSLSRDRGYELDDGESRHRHHRRHETDERSDDWDSRSVISEARSEGTGERRRKHRHRRDSERNGSPEDYKRLSVASEPGDIERERKSSRRKSRRGDDENESILSSPARFDEERSPRKEKEKRSSGLLGLFGRSKENLAETAGKSKLNEDDDEERRHRKKKHRERGSIYGSDDDDARSTVSSSSRREKRRSRTDSWEEKV